MPAATIRSPSLRTGVKVCHAAVGVGRSLLVTGEGTKKPPGRTDLDGFWWRRWSPARLVRGHGSLLACLVLPLLPLLWSYCLRSMASALASILPCVPEALRTRYGWPALLS